MRDCIKASGGLKNTACRLEDYTASEHSIYRLAGQSSARTGSTSSSKVEGRH